MPSDTSCLLPKGATSLHLRGTSHTTLFWLSLASTALTFISSVTPITLHLRRYRAPKAQRQIIRILIAPFVFASVSLACIADYSIAAYITPLSELYEAFCLCALFLLYVHFAAPTASATFGEDLFLAVKQAEETSSDLNWPRTTRIAVSQFPVVEVVAIYGHIWVEVIRSLGVAVYVLAIFRLYGRMKKLMKARRGFSKLLMLKIIVFVRFAQTWIFSILLSHSVITPSASFTYGDLTYGLPNALMCVETVLFSAAFWYAFSSSEYSSLSHPAEPLPLWSAALDALNPMDLGMGVCRAGMLLLGRSKRTSSEPRPRAGKGRYRTLDGMESLSRPGASYHSPETSYDSAMGVPQQHQGSASPPLYDTNSSYLMTSTRVERSPSPGGRVQGRDTV